MKLQNKPHTVRDIIVVGFALFAMFFGAGNVIFPPYLGVEAGPEWLGCFSAYFIADIGLAMCAVFALLRVGSSEAVRTLSPERRRDPYIAELLEAVAL